MTARYRTNGVCAAFIDLDTDGKTVRWVELHGGCHGQGQALAAMVRGRPVLDVVKRLKGISCGIRGTSCADQLARALEAAAKQCKAGQRKTTRKTR